ncbi:hypothetical protein FACUT_3898 [Fusarium acutatum]|uniref:Uncharacterized protein n=1 Tax=Fusarium acutatum TaxID=78861 RepID=A0A8H4JZB5_9HYPO|nr:hypothetical protein FACUT_3898 [Fusarium acutatum]
MHTISILTIILSIIANRALCSTKFLRPPEWNLDVDGEAGWEQNIQYNVGDTIQLLWETDLDKVELYLIQEKGSGNWDDRMLDASRTEWKAEWDVIGTLEGNEDSVYKFALGDPLAGYLGFIAVTQYFNVTAPKPETTITTTLQTSTTIQSISPTRVASSATQPPPTSTVTDQSSGSDADPDPDSGISKGEIAGAAVGGTIGGLILLGILGWLFWRRLGRSKKDTDPSVISQSQQFHSSETKAELPGDSALEVNPSGYARSPPGLYEAP